MVISAAFQLSTFNFKLYLCRVGFGVGGDGGDEGGGGFFDI